MKKYTGIKRYSILIAMIWPVIGLIIAIKNYKKYNIDGIILAFCGLYGFTFVLGEEMDGQRYAERLKVAHNLPFSAFTDQLLGLYETSLDFMQPLLTFLVSRFTNSYHVLFAVYGLIFGWFWLKSIRLVSRKFRFNQNKMTVLFVVFFIAINPIFNINGFRMWTAAWIFIYGALHVVLNNDRKFFLVCLAACSLHFSFLTANVILLLWMVLGNHKWTYLILAFVTLAVSEIDLSVVRSYAEMLGPAIENKANAYAGEEYASKVGERSTPWFISLSSMLRKYLLILNMVLLFMMSLKQKLPKEELNLLCFTLLFFCFSNIMGLVPSGGRFMKVYAVFSCVLSIVLYSKYMYVRLNSILGLLSMATISLSLLLTIRIAAPTINTVLFSPSVLIPFGFNLDWPIQNWLF